MNEEIWLEFGNWKLGKCDDMREGENKLCNIETDTYRKGGGTRIYTRFTRCIRKREETILYQQHSSNFFVQYCLLLHNTGFIGGKAKPDHRLLSKSLLILAIGILLVVL